jgi:hypothetical protein
MEAAQSMRQLISVVNDICARGQFRAEGNQFYLLMNYQKTSLLFSSERNYPLSSKVVCISRGAFDAQQVEAANPLSPIDQPGDLDNVIEVGGSQDQRAETRLSKKTPSGGGAEGPTEVVVILRWGVNPSRFCRS